MTCADTQALADTQPLWSAAERRLAEEVPFGSADYIRERLAVIYRARLKMLVELTPEAERLGSVLESSSGGELEPFFLDPVVRSSIDDLSRAYGGHGERQPDDDQLEFLAHYGMHLDEFHREMAEVPRSFRQTCLDRPIRYWSNEEARTLRDRAFLATLRQNLPGPRAEMVNAKTEATINQALALLQELLPSAGYSAVSHLYFIATDDFDNFVGSATIAPIHGAIFLFRRTLKNPWTTAEAILHECMHLKFVELEHTHSMFAKGYAEKTSPRVNPPWHRETELWPMNRVLTAAHVYLTLTLYSRAAQASTPELEARYGPRQWSNLLVDPSAASERAQSLIDLALQYPESLGKAGRVFLTWMNGILREVKASRSLERQAI